MAFVRITARPPTGFGDGQRDREAGIKLQPPAMVLWGEQGVVHQCFDPLLEWQRVASDVGGECMPCGHYIARKHPKRFLNGLRRSSPDKKARRRGPCATPNAQ